MAETKRVKFKYGSSPYQAGEVAGLSAERADRLINAGIAEEVARGGTTASAAAPARKSRTAPDTDKMERGDQTKG